MLTPSDLPAHATQLLSLQASAAAIPRHTRPPSPSQSLRVLILSEATMEFHPGVPAVRVCWLQSLPLGSHRSHTSAGSHAVRPNLFLHRPHSLTVLLRMERLSPASPFVREVNMEGLRMVVHRCNPNTCKVEAGGLP